MQHYNEEEIYPELYTFILHKFCQIPIIAKFLTRDIVCYIDKMLLDGVDYMWGKSGTSIFYSAKFLEDKEELEKINKQGLLERTYTFTFSIENIKEMKRLMKPCPSPNT